MQRQGITVLRHPSWLRAYVVIAALAALLVPLALTVLSAAASNASIAEVVVLILASLILASVVIWAGYPAWLRELRVDGERRVVEFRDASRPVVVRGEQVRYWWLEARPNGERNVGLVLETGKRIRFPLDWDATTLLRDALGKDPMEPARVEGTVRVLTAQAAPPGQSILGYALAIVASAAVLAGIRWWVPAAENAGGAIFVLLFAVFAAAVSAYGVYLLLFSTYPRITLDVGAQRIVLHRAFRSVAFHSADVDRWGIWETVAAGQPRTNLVLEISGGKRVEHDITGYPEETLPLLRQVLGSEPIRYEGLQ